MAFGEDRFERIKKDLKSLQEDAEQTALVKMIDPGCQLRTIIKFAEKLDEGWSGNIKEHLCKKKLLIINGTIFSAHLNISFPEYLDQSKIKAVLGDDLSDYKSALEKRTLTFKPRF